MKPVLFPEANCSFGAPHGLTREQVETIPACDVQIGEGNLDGMRAIIVAWQPDAEDLARLNAGGLIYLMSCGVLTPHKLETVFPVKFIAGEPEPPPHA